MDFIEDKEFTKEDLDAGRFTVAIYEYCTFSHCDLSDAILNNSEFVECKFNFCNLSNAKVEKASFRTVAFTDSKLTGIDFSLCNQLMLEVSFDNCLLDYVSFMRLDLRKTVFNNCSMIRTFLDNADLSSSSFNNCNLENAVFIGTNLEKADLSTSYNFIIDPEENRVKKAKFSLYGAVGLLTKYGVVIE
jgi:fluoroquinolone resistance protein